MVWNANNICFIQNAKYILCITYKPQKTVCHQASYYKKIKNNKMTIPHKYMMAFLTEKTKFNILTWKTQEG